MKYIIVTLMIIANILLIPIHIIWVLYKTIPLQILGKKFVIITKDNLNQYED